MPFKYYAEGGFRDEHKVWLVQTTRGLEHPVVLPTYNNEVNHSPDGFAWGYGGSGPAQLAYALCRSRVGKERARHVYQQFKFRVVAKWPQDEGWEISDVEIDRVISEIEADNKERVA